MKVQFFLLVVALSQAFASECERCVEKGKAFIVTPEGSTVCERRARFRGKYVFVAPTVKSCAMAAKFASNGTYERIPSTTLAPRIAVIHQVRRDEKIPTAATTFSVRLKTSTPAAPIVNKLPAQNSTTATPKVKIQAPKSREERIPTTTTQIPRIEVIHQVRKDVPPTTASIRVERPVPAVPTVSNNDAETSKVEIIHSSPVPRIAVIHQVRKDGRIPATPTIRAEKNLPTLASTTRTIILPVKKDERILPSSTSKASIVRDERVVPTLPSTTPRISGINTAPAIIAEAPPSSATTAATLAIPKDARILSALLPTTVNKVPKVLPTQPSTTLAIPTIKDARILPAVLPTTVKNATVNKVPKVLPTQPSTTLAIPTIKDARILPALLPTTVKNATVNKVPKVLPTQPSTTLATTLAIPTIRDDTILPTFPSTTLSSTTQAADENLIVTDSLGDTNATINASKLPSSTSPTTEKKPRYNYENYINKVYRSACRVEQLLQRRQSAMPKDLRRWAYLNPILREEYKGRCLTNMTYTRSPSQLGETSQQQYLQDALSKSTQTFQLFNFSFWLALMLVSFFP